MRHRSFYTFLQARDINFVVIYEYTNKVYFDLFCVVSINDSE